MTDFLEEKDESAMPSTNDTPMFQDPEAEFDAPEKAPDDFVSTLDGDELFPVELPRESSDSGEAAEPAPAEKADGETGGDEEPLLNDSDSEGESAEGTGDGPSDNGEPVEAPRPKRRRTRKAQEQDEPAESADTEADGKEAAKSRSDLRWEARQREAERLAARKEKERFLSGWSSLSTAMRRGLIVTGVVSSVEIHHLGAPEDVSEDKVLLAVMVEGGYKVLVPLEEFYQKEPIDRETVSGLDTVQGQREFTRRKRALAEKLYELEIPLVITNMEMRNQDEDGLFDYAILGSRRRALDIIEAQNFGNGRNADHARIKQGDMVTATITSVSVHGIAVVIGGVDTRIPFWRLTYRYLVDARTVYRVGQQITVYISQIDVLPDGHHELTVDARMSELQSARIRQKLLPLGTRTLGVITSVRHLAPRPDHPNGALSITAYLKMYDMPALIRSLPPSYLGREPIAGDEVRLVVVGFTRGGFVVADCRNFNGAPGLLNH